MTIHTFIDQEKKFTLPSFFIPGTYNLCDLLSANINEILPVHTILFAMSSRKKMSHLNDENIKDVQTQGVKGMQNIYQKDAVICDFDVYTVSNCSYVMRYL